MKLFADGPPELYSDYMGRAVSVGAPCIVLSEEETGVVRRLTGGAARPIMFGIDDLARSFYRSRPDDRRDIVVVHFNALYFGTRRRSQYKVLLKECPSHGSYFAGECPGCAFVVGVGAPGAVRTIAAGGLEDRARLASGLMAAAEVERHVRAALAAAGWCALEPEFFDAHRRAWGMRSYVEAVAALALNHGWRWHVRSGDATYVLMTPEYHNAMFRVRLLPAAVGGAR